MGYEWHGAGGSVTTVMLGGEGPIERHGALLPVALTPTIVATDGLTTVANEMMDGEAVKVKRWEFWWGSYWGGGGGGSKGAN
jgi:hypothetical protein